MGCTSERMGAVGADRELDLKEQFVGRLAVGVLTAPDLAPKLGEFAWPEGENKGLAPVCLRGIVGMPGRLHPRPREPALRELVLTGEEPAVGHLVPERIPAPVRSEEHTSELQSRFDLVCRLLLEKKNHTIAVNANR